MRKTIGKAYLVGGGIGSLAAAAFMIRDGGVAGDDITILEEMQVLGGSLDGAGNARDGFVIRGGRMLTTENFECTWDLFKTIPSVANPDKSVYQETVEFNEQVRSHSHARLVDRNRAIVDVSSLGLSMADRLELLRVAEASESHLGSSRISDWFSSGFFETNFWYIWSTMFAFQPWHSAAEFRRYMHRFIKEFPRIETLAGVKRTVYNQYDSMVRPLVAWLEVRGVHLLTGCSVESFELGCEDGSTVIRGIRYSRDGASHAIAVGDADLVFFQNGSMTDASSLGSMTSAPERLTKATSKGWRLWEQLADGRSEFGRPSVFNSSVSETCWESFTVTLHDTAFFDAMEAFTGNEAGTGGLVTFKDSNWLLSVVLAHQPHFFNQPANVRVFWGYALHPDRIGDFVAKSMEDCSGAEILKELRGHLRLDSELFATANCIPCRMPYITSQFMPRAAGDRPAPVPPNTKGLALVSQFVEVPEDTVFTVEYSVRAAQMAVYELLGIDREIPPIRHYDKSPKAQLEALIKAFQ